MKTGEKITRWNQHIPKKENWEKCKWSEPTSDECSYTYPHHVSLNTAKPPLNELIFYDNAFSSAQYYGGLFGMKDFLIFFPDFSGSYTLPLIQKTIKKFENKASHLFVELIETNPLICHTLHFDRYYASLFV